MIILTLVMVFFGGAEYKWRAVQAGPIIWQEAERQGVDPYLVAAIGWVESRWRSDIKSKTSDCGILQVNLHYTKFTCEELSVLRVGIREGISKMRYWERRFGKREKRKMQWVCHYNGGNVCEEKAMRYWRKVYRVFVRLKRLASVK